ncbi:hypothetical protein LI328DRAFT_163830 [Trichoderma asperelloides]|nr:hypothetical protein LI328DRAFT_163830 [Trichoderma asperelloides]
MFDDLEDADLEEDGPSTVTATLSETAKYTPFTGENGLLRIGSQPFPPAVHIKWTPKKEATAHIKNNARVTFKSTDQKIKSSAHVDHDSKLSAIQDKLVESLAKQKNILGVI